MPVHAIWALRSGLEPSPDESRRLLRRELTDSDYVQGNLLERIGSWFMRRFDDASTTSAGPIGLVLVCLVLLLIALGVVLLVSRTRRGGIALADDLGVLPDARITAAEHRAAAEAAAGRGDLATAVLESFRAQAMRLVETGQLDDVPGATASELVGQMGRLRPDLAGDLVAAGRLFDEVHYGEVTATAAQVNTLLDLDTRLQRSLR